MRGQAPSSPLRGLFPGSCSICHSGPGSTPISPILERTNIVDPGRWGRYTLLLMFVTFSCADMQWDDLQRHLPGYDEWRNGNARERTKIVWENVQKNPNIVPEGLDI